MLETRGETEKENEKEEEEKGGDVRLRITFTGLLGLSPFTFLLISVTFDFTVIGALPWKCLKYSKTLQNHFNYKKAFECLNRHM